MGRHPPVASASTHQTPVAAATTDWLPRRRRRRGSVRRAKEEWRRGNDRKKYTERDISYDIINIIVVIMCYDKKQPRRPRPRRVSDG